MITLLFGGGSAFLGLVGGLRLLVEADATPNQLWRLIIGDIGYAALVVALFQIVTWVSHVVMWI